MGQAQDGKADEAATDGTLAASSAARMDSICHDVNCALATIVLCIDYLAGHAECGDTPAVADARNGVRAIAAEMNKLRELARAFRPDSSGSGVFRV